MSFTVIVRNTLKAHIQGSHFEIGLKREEWKM